VEPEGDTACQVELTNRQQLHGIDMGLTLRDASLPVTPVVNTSTAFRFQKSPYTEHH
jgi:hypothetical protein